MEKEKNVTGGEMKIEITPESIQDFTHGQYPSFYFIRHIFYHLREFPSLLEQADYKRLYEEVLDYQVWLAIEESGWKAEKQKENRDWIEFLADLAIKNGTESFSRDLVDRYLEHRRALWNREKQESPAEG